VSDPLEIFNSLPTPPLHTDNRRSFCATSGADGAYFRIAKSTAGHPYFLIPRTGAYSPPAIRLEHLEIEPEVTCSIRDLAGNTRLEPLTLIGCTSHDPELQAYFVRILVGILGSLGSSPTIATLVRATSTIAALFRAQSEPSKRTVQGLWAEMFIIAESERPQVLLSEWHSDPRETFDFGGGHERLEVKSSTDGRRHHFRFEQLSPPAGTRVVIASVIVRTIATGASIGDLLDRIQASVAASPELVSRLSETVATTLGEDWKAGLKRCFDVEMARESLQFYDGTAVPVVHGPIPPEISEVRFVADLGGSRPLVDPTGFLSQGLVETAMRRLGPRTRPVA
jgi:hypothetical protein